MLQIQAYPFYSYITALVILSLMLFGFAFSVFYHVRRKRAQMKAKNFQDECLMEAERKRIAADLHDDFGSLLNGLQLSITTLADQNPSDVFFSSTVQRLDDSILRLREISLNLVPRELEDEGINAAVESLVERINGSNRIKATFTKDIDLHGTDTNRSMLLYRVIQEITTNAIKHSAAKHIKIGIAAQGNYVILEIKDDGHGFDFESGLTKKGSSGLKNIQSRLELLNAILMIDSNSINGTHYYIRIPMRQLAYE